MVSLILRNFAPLGETESGVGNSYLYSPRICGSWVTALPELTTDVTRHFAGCLDSAVSTLALSITAHRSQEDLFQVASIQYESSIHHLVRNLAVAGNIYRNELVAAVMCLALSEALLPISPVSWLVHVEGVSNMIQLSPPESFESGVEHTLFIGFRPLLILKAFILRKATFFANDEWVEKPFQHHQAAPLQSLLSLAARIPAILEKIDNLAHVSLETSVKYGKERITELMETKSCLETWHSSFLNSTSAPQYWHCMPDNALESGHQLLWYPDLSTANVFTYFWSFQLICLTNIQSLREQYPDLEKPEQIAADDIEGLRDTCLELSIRIYQSMEYVLQEDFMLYGISSVGFPLQTACKAFDSDAKGRAVLETLDHTVIVRSRIQNI